MLINDDDGDDDDGGNDDDDDGDDDGSDDDDDVSCGSGWPRTCYIAEDDFELLILPNTWITGIPGYNLIPHVDGIMQSW